MVLMAPSSTKKLSREIGRQLLKKKGTVAVAESCTGGLISKILTDTAGSSQYFIEGMVTYANRSKNQRLGVPSSLLTRFGAVSPQVARAMAVGLRKKSGASFSVSVTGIAGPEGGTMQKPVGLVFIGVSSSRRILVSRHRFSGSRSQVCVKSALKALSILNQEIKK